MSKLRKMLCLAWLTTITSSCSTNLPESFPKAPGIDLCSPAVITAVYDDGGRMITLPRVVYTAKGEPFELIATYAICEHTETRKRHSESIKFIQIGVNKEDWLKGQNFRRAAEGWIIKHGND